jgi:hypothetical protein
MSVNFLIDNSDDGYHQIVVDGFVRYTGLYNDKNRSQDFTVEQYIKEIDDKCTIVGAINYDTHINSVLKKKYTDSLKYMKFGVKSYENVLKSSLPLKWFIDSNGIEKFLLLERQEGCFSKQYAKFNDICLEKVVDIFDESTWISYSDFRPYLLSLDYMRGINYDENMIAEKLAEIQNIGESFSSKCVVAMQNLIMR